MGEVSTRTVLNSRHRGVMTALAGVLLLVVAACGGSTDDASEPGSAANVASEEPTASSPDVALGDLEPLCDEVFSRDLVEEVLGSAPAPPTGDLGFGVGLGYCEWLGDDGASYLRFESESTNNDCTSGDAADQSDEIAGLGERAFWSFDEFGGQLIVCAFYDADFAVGAELTLLVGADREEPQLRAGAEDLAAAGLSWLDRNGFGPNQR